MRISVVIPNWNGAARLARLLASLERQTEKAWEVLVVDNASTDSSQAAATAAGAQWLPLDQNYGFARAVNTGIRQARGEAVAIVNNDVTLAPECLSKLGGALGEHAFAAPRIVSAADPGRLDGTFDLTSRGFCSWRAGHGFPVDSTAFGQPRVIASAPMTAAVYRRSVFDQAGLLDEQFGSYLEDIDFGLRCALQGIRGYYEPAAIATHEGSATLGGEWNSASVRWIARNQVLLAKKYGAKLSWPVWTGQGLWGLLALKRGSGLAWIQGKIEGYRLQVLQIETGNLSQILQQQEREIQALLASSGASQFYWSAYAALTGGAD